jgi:transcriptional regulator GlxA family with amidase domain
MTARLIARFLGTVLVTVLLGWTSPVHAADEKPKPERKTRVNVAILLFEGVELLDFAGPAEVFGVAGEGQSFKVFTVAESTDLLRAMGGVSIKPDYTVKDAPKADVLVVPGGGMRNLGEAGRAWLKKAAKDAEIVMSVCMGAFLLAEAGLLDGVEATTHHWGIENLKKAAPKCKVVSERRFVDSGKVITTGGVTAGIDGALHVVERLYGKEAARWTAEEWMEYRRDAAVPKR